MTQLERVVEAVRAVSLGAYLYGSATNGGLRPGSDLDVLVVSERRLEAQERHGVIERLLGVSGDGRAVEVTVLALPELRPWRHPPRIELQYGEWWRDALVRGDEPWPDADPDATILAAMALASSRPLLGPPLAELLDPVPPELVRRALLDDVPILMPGLETDTRYAVLTLTRIWYTLETGSFASKDVAAGWALARVPEEHRPLLAAARDAYVNGGARESDALVVPAKAYAAYLAGLIPPE